MFRKLYSLGFKKQEIYLIAFSIAVVMTGIFLKYILHSEPPKFDYSNVRTGFNDSAKYNFYDSTNIKTRKEIYSSENRLNINTADETQLDMLPGIGSAIAKEIIKYRSKQKFSNIKDIMKVKGIGQKKFEKLKDIITVN